MSDNVMACIIGGTFGGIIVFVVSVAAELPHRNARRIACAPYQVAGSFEDRGDYAVCRDADGGYQVREVKP